MASKTASLVLEVDSKGVTKGGDALDRLSKSSDAATKSSKTLKVATVALTAATAAASAAIVTTTRSWLRYDKAMKEVESISGQTSDEFKNVRTNLLGVSRDLGIATDDMASASFQAVSAGVDAKNIGTFMEDAGRLAIAGVASTTTAVDILTTAVNAYGLASADAADVSDKLFTAAKLGKTNLTEVASSFAKAAPLAATMGISIDELLTSMVVMTKQGISTAESFTKINGIMTAFVKPSDAMREQLLKIGQESGTASIKSLGLQGSIKALSDSVNGDTEAMGQLFPQIESLSGSLALMTQDGDLAVQTLSEMENSTGAVSKAFDTNSKALDIQINKFKALAVTIAEGFEEETGALRNLLQVMEGINRVASGGEFFQGSQIRLKMTQEELAAWNEMEDKVEGVKTVLSDLSDQAVTHGVNIDELARKWAGMDDNAKNFMIGLNDQEKELISAYKEVITLNEESVAGSKDWLFHLDLIVGSMNSGLTASQAQLELQKQIALEFASQELQLSRVEKLTNIYGQTRIEKLTTQKQLVEDYVSTVGVGTKEQLATISALDEQIKRQDELNNKRDKPPGESPSSPTGGGSATDSLLSVRESLMTEEEALQESYNNRREIVLNATTITEQERNRLLEDLRTQHEIKLTEITRDAEEERARQRQMSMSHSLGVASDFFGGISALASSQGKKGAKIAKAAAITQATIKTYEGVQAAFTSQAGIPVIGPNLATAAAAGALAMGLANIAAIKSQPIGNYAQGGIVPGTSFSGDNVPANVNSGEMILNRTQQANLFSMANGHGSGGNVTIINQTRAPVDAEVVNNAGVMQVVIREAVETAKAELTDEINTGNGAFAPMLQNTFALQRGLV